MWKILRTYCVDDPYNGTEKKIKQMSRFQAIYGALDRVNISKFGLFIPKSKKDIIEAITVFELLR